MGIFGTIGSMKHRSKPAEEESHGMYERTKSAFYGSNAAGTGGDGELPNIKATCAKSFSMGTRAPKERAQPVPPPAQPEVQYNNINQFSNMTEIYNGSISTVYKAICVETGTKVVIKVYHKVKMNDRHFHKLDREIEIQSKVQDGPYVCKLYAIFEDDDKKYLVLEMCEGGDLFKLMLMRGGKLDEAFVCTEIIVPLLRICEKMHAHNILHRDIKPENIFLTKDNKFKLGDFGLAIDIGEEIPFCRSGTLDYMAPEVLFNPSTSLQEGNATAQQLQQRGIKPYGPKIDVWAAGVLAYELVRGSPPFEVEDESQTVALILTSNNITFPSHYSSAWADFCRFALTKKPSKRPCASLLLEHPWIIQHMVTAISSKVPRPTKEQLLDPLPIAHNPHAYKAKDPNRPQRSAISFAPVKPKSEALGDMGDMQDALRDLRQEFGGDTSAPTGDMRGLEGKGAVSFTVPAENYQGVNVAALSKEEMGETGAAIGMKARVKFYMTRQKM